ncbi:MAG: bile acid:sodium symporter family protein [Leptospira sp.]|jgi:bile acid:Na+ symporter, BASS family|nr:bile acid:sodium symporter family protein [Leptospira sp.]NCS95350.1 bile acid:sodium symporter family protein [Leptospira sp.]
MEELDTIRLNFNPKSLLLLNVSLGFIMYGISLDLKWQDFKFLRKAPLVFFLGMLSQFFLLPLATMILIQVLQPHPGIALGMVLVASCPGGNMSNFLTYLAKGNLPLSISLTAVSTLMAWILTPLNFYLWGSFYEPSTALLKKIDLDPISLILTIFSIMVLPMILGGLTNKLFPKFADKSQKYFKWISVALLFVFIVLALKSNWIYFIKYIQYLIWLVLLHNGLALIIGYSVGWIASLPVIDRKTLSIETGIQNSGLGLVLIFTFFGGMGSMALIAAWWGIWHLISGGLIALYWSRTKSI